MISKTGAVARKHPGFAVLAPSALLFAACTCGGGNEGPVDGGSNLTASGKFAYATNFNDDKVSEFKIDQTTGALSLVGTVNAGLGTGGAFGLAVHPSNKYLYVANARQGALYEFSINSSSGQLTKTGQVNFVAGVQPENVGLDPAGNFLYMTDANGGRVFQFSVNSSDGSVTALSPPSVGVATSGPIGIKIDPTGKFAYVAEQCGVDPHDPCGQVEAFKINSGGTLTSLGALDSLGPVSGPGSPSLLTIDPAGKNVFVADGFVGNHGEVISQFAIGSTGALSFVAAVPLGTGLRPFDIALSPNGSFAFSTTSSPTIARLTVSTSTGAMTPHGTVSSPGAGIAIDRGGQILYTARSDGKVAQFTIDSQGDLHPIANGSVDTESPPSPSSANIYIVIAG